MDNQIICPNCGAPNESTSISCQFCGVTLADADINQQKESETDISIKRVKGKPQIKYDRRIFRLDYDEIRDEAELRLSDNVISTTVGCDHFCYNFTYGSLELYGVETIISGGKRYCFEYTNSISCPSINKNNLGLLEKFCNLNLKNCRVDGFCHGEEILFVLVCRAYYNTIFDRSKYRGAADQLFHYIKEKEQKRIGEIKKSIRRENINQLLIALTFFGGLFLLGLIIKLLQGVL